MEANCRQIVDAIYRIWEKGITLSSEILFFLDSTFGITSTVELEYALKHGDLTDRDMIMEMLLYPDQRTHMAIEPLLGNAGLEQTQILEIKESLFGCNAGIRIHNPDGTEPLFIRLPHEQVEAYVRRLNLNRSLDPDICKLLENLLSRPILLSSRVLLRCGNFIFTEKKKNFLMIFIQNAGERNQDFSELFEITLSILSEAPEYGNIDDYFLKKRKQAANMLESIHRFEKNLDRYGMEYLMMSRYPVPHESLENIADTIRKLNIIIDEIFCFIPSTEPVPLVQNLGSFDPQEDMETLLKILK